jgi:hypothetical protein
MLKLVPLKLNVAASASLFVTKVKVKAVQIEVIATLL